jgi:sugar phosphate isomerase/epimerase
MLPIIFSKSFQQYPIAEFAPMAAAMGFSGIDLTVREGGHVEPGQARQELPKAVEAIRGEGLAVPLITSAIVSAGDPNAEAIFVTAGELGVPFIKLGYVRYPGFGKAREVADDYARELEAIAALARRAGVCAVIHTHSGDYMSADGLIVARWLEDHNPDEIAAYVDFGHLFREGGVSGWKLVFDFLAPYMRVVALKDFFWQKDEKTGRWDSITTPPGTGVVRWKEVLQYLSQTGFDGPASFHSEYTGRRSFRLLSVEEIRDQSSADLRYMRELAPHLFGGV